MDSETLYLKMARHSPQTFELVSMNICYLSELDNLRITWESSQSNVKLLLIIYFQHADFAGLVLVFNKQILNL